MAVASASLIGAGLPPPALRPALAAPGAWRAQPLTCTGHTRPVVDLAFSPLTPDGFFLVSACKDGKPMLRNGTTGDWLGTFEGHNGAVWSVAIDDRALRVATGAADFTAKLWDAASGDMLATFAHGHIVKGVSLSADAGLLATCCHDRAVRVFDAARPDAPAVHASAPHPAAPKRAVFLPGGQAVVTGGDDKTLRLWDLRSSDPAAAAAVAHPLSGPLTSLAVHAADGTLTVTHGTTIDRWNLGLTSRIRSYTLASPVYSAAVHPLGTQLAWGGADHLVHVMDAATGEELSALKAHFGPVHAVGIAPDGQLAATGSEDGTIRLWQTNPATPYGLWQRPAEL